MMGLELIHVIERGLRSANPFKLNNQYHTKENSAFIDAFWTTLYLTLNALLLKVRSMTQRRKKWLTKMSSQIWYE